MNKLFKNRKGQNTVEYLLMLAVVVGVVLVAGAAPLIRPQASLRRGAAAPRRNGETAEGLDSAASAGSAFACYQPGCLILGQRGGSPCWWTQGGSGARGAMLFFRGSAPPRQMDGLTSPSSSTDCGHHCHPAPPDGYACMGERQRYKLVSSVVNAFVKAAKAIQRRQRGCGSLTCIIHQPRIKRGNADEDSSICRTRTGYVPGAVRV